ncbi:hypothetical protein Taro_003911 [Colocasia esculenta]|uniref:non-specific serine/threonine protein kinase n=1 Tax=Colocasia esculenta TaxID=4460 RepID=A0A843TKQ9_COLES|nr:hypothetical protein [Colocasia esculenta]
MVCGGCVRAGEDRRDLGLTAIVEGKNHAAHSVLGTPEFMASELYEYKEQVDIYSFEMCVMESVMLEIPYSEYDSVEKIYERARRSATNLLKDNFFYGLDDEDP